MSTSAFRFRRLLRAARGFLLLWFVLGAAPAGAAQETGVAMYLRQRLEQLDRSGSLDLGGIMLGREDILAGFYARRAWQPAWTDPARVGELLALLADAPSHGLDPADFFLARLSGPAPARGDDAALADRDLLLTEALVRYGYQRRFGKVNPEELEPAWNFGRGFANGAEPEAVLEEAIAAPSLAAYIDEKIPPGPWYRQLRAALQRYRALSQAGGWPAVEPGPTLRPGDRDPRVAALRERLRIESDLAADAVPPADPEAFDDAIAAAMKAFQDRHALDRDGTLGPRTLAALNVPVADRMDQIRMSLERVRWLNGRAPATYVVVNVAGFRVAFVRDHRLLWNSRVVVGRAARQTPIFRDDMTYVEINPTWTVPPTILREDILPKVKKDPGYLRRENISVIDRDGRTLDPYAVNWAAYARAVPYTLRQEPGPSNSLGRIKLMFPNPHAVYLHDTPAKGLFEQPERTFSSGCIRVEDPLALAELVLNDPAWTRASLEAAIATNKTRRVTLKEPVPVMLVYLTAVADSSGVTRFYRDVYERDPSLLRALNGPVKIELPKPRVASGPEKMGPASL